MTNKGKAHACLIKRMAGSLKPIHLEEKHTGQLGRDALISLNWSINLCSWTRFLWEMTVQSYLLNALRFPKEKCNATK